jgi:hypothetical protein
MPLGRALQLQLLLPAGGDPRRGPWASVTHIRLIHVSTDHALHFHAGFAHPQWTMGQPEVTGLLGRDDDLWFATDLSACHSRFITQSVRANGQRRGGRSSAPSLWPGQGVAAAMAAPGRPPGPARLGRALTRQRPPLPGTLHPGAPRRSGEMAAAANA